ncbi:hypothetical protein HDU88_000876 [Geranomyces variabilis]|nr:hypothetical protein HDU88_000876 [Geranomyces variabilis]
MNKSLLPADVPAMTIQTTCIAQPAGSNVTAALVKKATKRKTAGSALSQVTPRAKKLKSLAAEVPAPPLTPVEETPASCGTNEDPVTELDPAEQERRETERILLDKKRKQAGRATRTYTYDASTLHFVIPLLTVRTRQKPKSLKKLKGALRELGYHYLSYVTDDGPIVRECIKAAKKASSSQNRWRCYVYAHHLLETTDFHNGMPIMSVEREEKIVRLYKMAMQDDEPPSVIDPDIERYVADDMEWVR